MSKNPAFNEKTLIKAMDKAGITHATERAMFLAQMNHETGGFKYDEEIASGAAYEGRKDLGNTQAGDGTRYKGRGFIQITGRANYQKYGDKLGVDLVGNPDMAKNPQVAADVSVAYWMDRVDRKAAQQGDIVAVTKDINGGRNGLQDRKDKFAHYQKDATVAAAATGLTAPTQVSALSQDFIANHDPLGQQLQSIEQQYSNRQITNEGQFRTTLQSLKSRMGEIYDEANVPKYDRTLTLGMHLGAYSAAALLNAPDNVTLDKASLTIDGKQVGMTRESVGAFFMEMREAGVDIPAGKNFTNITAGEFRGWSDAYFDAKLENAVDQTQRAQTGQLTQQEQQANTFFDPVSQMLGGELGGFISMIVSTISMLAGIMGGAKQQSQDIENPAPQPDKPASLQTLKLDNQSSRELQQASDSLRGGNVSSVPEDAKLSPIIISNPQTNASVSR